MIDPTDDLTFWATHEYATSAGNWDTRIASFGLIPESLVISNETLTGTQTFRAGSITASPNVIVADGADITFEAGSSITLGPGFKAEKGSVFLATTDLSGSTSTSGASLATTSSSASSSTEASSDKSGDERSGNSPADASTAARSQSVPPLPQKLALGSLYPNPARNRRVTVPLALPERATVGASVYDVLGRRVQILTAGRSFAAGYEELAFSTEGLSSGLYLIRVRVEAASGEERVFTEKFTVVR